jgi:replicative DNA helicase
MLLSANAIDEAMQILAPDDFYRPAHQVAFEQIVWLRAHGKAADAVTLGERLELIGEFERLGGNDFLYEIGNAAPHDANVAFHADVIAQKSVVRKLIEAASETIRDAYSNAFTAQTLIEEAERKVFAIRDKNVSNGTRSIAMAVDDAIRAMDKVKSGGEVDWIVTGIAPLDKILLGMRPGQLIVLAGRPGAGKSALAAQIARFVSNPTGQNTSTLLISLEMTDVEFARRMISSAAGLNSSLMKTAKLLTESEEDRITNAAGAVAISRLQIDETPGQSLMQISANARRWKHKDHLGILIVDYLQKIHEPFERGGNKVDVIEKISGGLKDLAKELSIPVIALAQLNREADKEDRPPRMSDLRSGGSIEQDADVVLLLHNKTPKGVNVGPVDLIVDKNRDGETDTIELVFNRSFGEFTPAARSGEVRAAEFRNDPYIPPPDTDEPDYDDPNIVPFR